MTKDIISDRWSPETKEVDGRSETTGQVGSDGTSAAIPGHLDLLQLSRYSGRDLKVMQRADLEIRKIAASFMGLGPSTQELRAKFVLVKSELHRKDTEAGRQRRLIAGFVGTFHTNWDGELSPALYAINTVK